jgi:hypothetical protein
MKEPELTGQAFIIIAHENWHQVAQLVRVLECTGARLVTVHVDAKAPDRIEALKIFSRLGIDVLSQQAIYWGHYSMIKAIQSSINHILESDGDQISHVSLISGTDWPMMDVWGMERYLSQNPGDYIECYDMRTERWITEGYYNRRYRYYWPLRPMRLIHHLFAIANFVLGSNRRMYKNLQPYSGSQWWTLTRTAVLTLQESFRDQAFRQFFGSTFIPDEMAPHTILRNHPQIGPNIKGRNLRFIEWVGRGRPKKIDGKDIHAFFQRHRSEGPFFFARKIDLSTSYSFLVAVNAPLPSMSLE